MKRGLPIFLVSLLILTQFMSIEVKAMTDQEFICADTTATFSVDEVITNNNLVNLKCFTDFASAKAYLNSIKATKPNAILRSKSHAAPNRILGLASSGYAIATGALTVNIYRNPDKLTEWNAATEFSTYVTGPDVYSNINGTKMYYYDTVINKAGQYMYKVAVSGYVGYVDAAQADLLPAIYVLNDYPFTLRHAGQTRSYSKVDADYYLVKPGANGKNELYYLYGPVGGGMNMIGPYALAPSWLPAGYYYSDNGNQFYSDFTLTKNVSPNNKFFNYYQYLPLRTRSNLTGSQLDQYLSSIGMTHSVYYGKSQEFVNAQNKYGMNALLVFAMAGLESAFGTSYYAKNRNNLFGWNAVDSNPDNATVFASVSQAINEHMGINLFGYSDVNDYRFTAPSLGNKGAGFNTKYASDPYWGLKISSIAYNVDKTNGFGDLNYYGLGIISDHTNVNVYQSASTTSPIYYNTKGETKGLINQAIAVTRGVGSFYESTSWYPIVNGQVLTYHSNGNYVNNIDKSLGYVPANQVTLINNSRWKAVLNDTTAPSPTPPPTPITTGDSGEFKVTATAGLSLRTEPDVNSTRLTVIPYNTTLSGTYVNNNSWVKTTYGGKTGYVSAEYLSVVKINQPVIRTYRVKATDGLIVRDSASISGARLGALVYNTEVKGTPVENGTWVKIDYQGKVGYISAQYLSDITNTPTPQPNPTPSVTKINVPVTLGYTLSGSTLTGMNLTTAISNVVNKIKAVDAKAVVAVVNASGTTKSTSSVLTTGDKLTITQAGLPPQVFTIAVKGDINGDGKISNFDFVSIQRHLLGISKLTNEKLIAGDINSDGKVSNFDFVSVQRDLLNIAKLHK